jgi:hypothetical protein
MSIFPAVPLSISRSRLLSVPQSGAPKPRVGPSARAAISRDTGSAAARVRQFTLSVRQYTLFTRQITLSVRQLTLSMRQFTLSMRQFTLSMRQFTLSMQQFTLSMRQFALPIARTVLGWPKRCKLAQAVLWEYRSKRLKLAQFLGQLGVFLTHATVHPPSECARRHLDRGHGVRPPPRLYC